MIPAEQTQVNQSSFYAAMTPIKIPWTYESDRHQQPESWPTAARQALTFA
jgi:hypothetical protein